MSVEASLRDEQERAERRETAIITAIPYFLLGTSTVITLLYPAGVHLAAASGLTGVTAVWLAWPDVLGRRGNSGGALSGMHYAGLMLLAAGLVVLAPWYGIFAFAGYVHAFMYLKGTWRYAGVVVTSLLMSVTYMGGWAAIDADNEWRLWGGVFLVSTVLSATFFYFAATTDQRGHRQRDALDALHAANLRLESALRDNATLHARLLTQARQAGVLDERQRIAREIHDTLAQNLAGILTQLQSAEQTLHDLSILRRHITNATDLAREGLSDARRTVHAVQPQALADAGLPEAIGDVTGRWSGIVGIRASLTITGDPRPLHADVEVTLLRAAQEALANVAKHSEATRVGLTLSYMDDVVTLDVRDDGAGFDPHSIRENCSTGGGFGLKGMRERVQQLAGTLVVESEPGNGTALSVSVPAIPIGGIRGDLLRRQA